MNNVYWDDTGMRPALLQRSHPAGLGGVQKIYRFQNGYGASVILSPYSYGNKEGLWELAVVHYPSEDDDYEITYDTHITNDVVGHCSVDVINDLLNQIEGLPPVTIEVKDD